MIIYEGGRSEGISKVQNLIRGHGREDGRRAAICLSSRQDRTSRLDIVAIVDGPMPMHGNG